MSKKKYGKIGSLLNQNSIMIASIAVVVIVLLAAIIGIVVMVSSDDTQPTPSVEPSIGTTEVTSDLTEATEPSTEATQAPTEESTEATTEPTSPPATAPRPTAPRPTDPPKTVIKLPYTIPGTSLVVQRVANYTGIYLEDGTNSEIADVAMMLLYNSGSEPVEFANCTLIYDDKTLQFNASSIPAGASIAVQEISKQSCAAGDLTKCTADIATMPAMEMSKERVSVEDNGNNTLTVTNLSDQDIVTVRIFYKYYLADEDVYIGGIAFSAKLSNLKAGESVVISPRHFASEGSVILQVRTYDVDV